MSSLPCPLQIPSHHMETRSKTGHLKPKKIYDLLDVTNSSSTPTCYTQASKIQHLRDAMSAEFDALQKQGTWSLTSLPHNAPVLGCKWTYKTKLYPDGKIECYKARHVAQGYTQQYGINYKDTLSPVAKMPTICVLLIIAT